MLSITGKAARVSLNKRFDVTIAGEINLDLVLDGIPETMPGHFGKFGRDPGA
jgi:hypothetical protein